jgi:hypothetical protein
LNDDGSAAKEAPAPEHICVYRGDSRDAYRVIEPRVQQEIAGKSSASSFEVTFVDDVPGEAWPVAAETAFEYAASVWGQLLTSTVPIRVEATWKDLGDCSGSTYTLGAAGPKFVRRNFAGRPVSDTWYPDALADALGGVDLGAGEFDIVADFNSSCGPGATGRWYFGTDASPPAGRVDFASVVIHELGHGLGFFGSANVDDGDAGNGAECTGPAGAGCIGIGDDADPVAYDRFTTDGSGAALVGLANPSISLGVALAGGQGGGVFFDGVSAREANGGTAARLYAPSIFNAATTYSHLDESTYNNTSHALMTPFVSQAEAIHDPGDVACGIMADIGWSVTSSCGASPPSQVADEVTDAYPNPFNVQTAVHLTLAEAQHVRVEVFDLLGRRVALLHEGSLASGIDYRFSLDANGLPAGPYFILIRGDTVRASRVVTRVK